MQKSDLFLKVKDHSVSGEEFELHWNAEKDVLITHPHPSEEDLPHYYESEDYISHTNTKRNLLESLYHFVRGLSIKRKIKLIDRYSEGNKTILDVGCGTGHFLAECKNKGWKSEGVEPNEKARKISISKDLEVAEKLEEKISEEKSFQIITLWHVLEHLPNLNKQISMLESLLNETGYMIIAVPNFRSFDANYYKEHWAAYDVPRHLWHFSQDGIKRIFNSYGFDLIKTYPMKFDSYYVSLLSEKYKSGWMNFFNAFLVGSRSNLKANSSGEYSSIIYVFKKG